MAGYNRFALIDYEAHFEGDAKKVTVTTDVPFCLIMDVMIVDPLAYRRWLDFRGFRIKCGIKQGIRVRFSIEQEEECPSTTHTFWIRRWEHEQQMWWFFRGHRENNLSPSRSAIFTNWYPGYPIPPGPQPTPIVIKWNVPNRIIRCGNRYTWYAQGHWYVMIPTPTSLTVWKLDDTTMTRMDQANEPSPAHGLIADADSRLDFDGDWISCSYFSNVASPGPHELYWANFSTYADRWSLHELICEPVYSPFALYHTSIGLESVREPRVVYTDYPGMFPELHYRRRDGIVWSPAELAIKVAFKAIAYSSCWIDPANNAFHVTGVANTSEHWYNRRPPDAPPWDGNTQMGTNINLGMQSIMAGQEIPHVAGMSMLYRADHYEDQPPFSNQQDLSPLASTYANMIAPADVSGNLLIMFSDPDKHLSWIWRPPLMDWQPPLQLTPDNVYPLSANYNAPDIVSCLWQEPGSELTDFYAFWAPWH